MLVVEKSSDAKGKTPHLALTHEAQGGPANKRKVSLVMKGIEELTAEQQEALDAFLKTQQPSEGVDVSSVEKATYHSLRRKIDSEVSDYARRNDRWGWAYVRDFDDKNVVVSDEDGVHVVGYTITSDGEIELSDTRTTVNEMISYVDKDGNILVSESDSISSEVSSLVLKSFESPKADSEKLTEIFKSKYTEGILMEEKDKQIAELQAAVEKANQTAAEFKALLQEKEEKEAAARSEQRKDVLKSVVAEAELESIHKSLDGLDQDAFDTVVKALKTTKENAENASGLFEQVSKSGTAPESDESPMAGIIEILKSQNA